MAEGVRKRGKTWSYYFDTAPIDGKRNKIEKGGFRTQKEAAEARIEAMNKYNNTGLSFTPKQISTADYLDYWLENAVKKNIDHGYSYNTYLGYESAVRVHLKPTFGMYKLSVLQYSPDKIQSWVDDLKIKGFAKSMIEGVLSCLSTALTYAILPLKYIQENPCKYVKIGKMPVDRKRKEHTEYICSKDEFKKILERFPKGNPFHISLLTPYYTGTRISETFGIDLLRDVDFEKHELSITNQLIKKDKTWYYKEPKYDSFRTLKIGNTLEKALKDTIRQYRTNQLKYGSKYLKTYLMPDKSIVQFRADIVVPYQEIMPLCLKDNGELLTSESFKYCARVIHYELGNPLFHSHCLRHTHGTILAENGVNPKTVMERLGHKDVETTLNRYTFNTESMAQKACDIFESVSAI